MDPFSSFKHVFHVNLNAEQHQVHKHKEGRKVPYENKQTNDFLNVSFINLFCTSGNLDFCRVFRFTISIWQFILKCESDSKEVFNQFHAHLFKITLALFVNFHKISARSQFEVTESNFLCCQKHFDARTASSRKEIFILDTKKCMNES